MGKIVFVGNLPLDIRESEVEDLFRKFGYITRVDMKLPARAPGFAFVEFEDERDAEDSVRDRDGYDFYGSKLRVELAHGGGRGGDRGESSAYPRRGGLGPAPFGPSRRTGYRVRITDLPLSCSWQDLKDHMRKAGEVTFAQVFREHDSMQGIVDYASFEDMRYAVRKLDDTLFKNPFDQRHIRVREDKDGGGDYRRSRSRSPSRGRSRSPSRDRSHTPPRKRSRSRDYASRSRSRSRDRRSRS